MANKSIEFDAFQMKSIEKNINNKFIKKLKINKLQKFLNGFSIKNGNGKYFYLKKSQYAYVVR